MTSNLPVVGVEQALSGHLASAAIERGLARPHGVGGGISLDATGTPASALAGVDSEFARVLLEVMTADARPRGVGAFRDEPPPLLAASAGDPAQLLRALAADARLEWVAAPLVHRAIDAYRELMNVAG
jgi:hypothetical protein